MNSRSSQIQLQRERERQKCSPLALVVLLLSSTSYKTRFTTTTLFRAIVGIRSLFAIFIISVKRGFWSTLPSLAGVSSSSSTQTTLTAERKISAAAVKEELVWVRTHTNSLQCLKRLSIKSVLPLSLYKG